MSLATFPTPSPVITPAPRAAAVRAVDPLPYRDTASRPQGPAPVSTEPEARGFALYVGLDPQAAAIDGTSLTELVRALREVLAERAPHASSYASVAFAPHGAPGDGLDLVRLALQEPRSVAEQRATRREEAEQDAERRSSAKVIIDTSRKRVSLLGENADFTYKEFELLQVLVLREGRTVPREEIIDVLWRDSSEERPHERTIDVHVRRLRRKLGDYAGIVRTVRSGGYRFDRHADVQVVHAAAPSPDR